MVPVLTSSAQSTLITLSANVTTLTAAPAACAERNPLAYAGLAGDENHKRLPSTNCTRRYSSSPTTPSSTTTKSSRVNTLASATSTKFCGALAAAVIALDTPLVPVRTRTRVKAPVTCQCGARD